MPHRDHHELLPDVLNDYEVRHVWDSGQINETAGYERFIAAVQDEPDVIYHSARAHLDPEYEVRFESRGTLFTLNHGHRIHMRPVLLGRDATMTFLGADGQDHGDPNEGSLVVRLDLGDRRVLLMGDAEAGARRDPGTAPDPFSVEGLLLACCTADLRADVLVVGHHGSKTSSRTVFLDAVQAEHFIVSSGPKQFGAIVLPDAEVITALKSRGQVFRTDLRDDACEAMSIEKIGAPGPQPGGCDNIQIRIETGQPIVVDYFPTPLQAPVADLGGGSP